MGKGKVKKKKRKKKKKKCNSVFVDFFLFLLLLFNFLAPPLHHTLPQNGGLPHEPSLHKSILDKEGDK
jgi:hypothetical protein